MLLLTGSSSVAQTTQPGESDAAPEDPWGRLVEQFTQAAFNRDQTAVKGFIAKGATLASFDGEKVRGLPEAFHEIADGKLVTMRAYQSVPESLASDLAKDVEGSTAIPDEKKSQFIPQAEFSMRHANETAAEWVRRSLAIDGSTGLVGVIAVWHPKAAGASRDQPGLVFLLLNGKVGEKHEPAFQITRIVVGCPIKS